MNPYDLLDANLRAPDLSENEKALRDLFCIEYVKDFNEVQACIRMGFMASYAATYGQRYLEEPYVQRQIASLQRKQQLTEEEQREEDKALIMAVLRQAAQHGPYASRVQAAKQLAVMHGLDKNESDGGEEQLISAFKEFASQVQGLDQQKDTK